MEPNEYEDAWCEGEKPEAVAKPAKAVATDSSAPETGDATADQAKAFADAFNEGEPMLGGEPSGKAGD